MMTQSRGGRQVSGAEPKDDSSEISMWHRPLPDPPPPTALASDGLVGSWLRQAELDLGITVGAEQVAKWAAKNKRQALPIAEALDGERDGSRPYVVAGVAAPQNDELWNRWAQDEDTACCPVPRWNIGATTGKQSYTMVDCTSWRCPRHSPPKAQAILAAACREWLRFDTIFHGQAGDEKAINRVRSTARGSRKAAQHWFVLRRDRQGWSDVTTIDFFSTVDLAGPRTTKPPTKWQALRPEEAVERLARALSLPGVVRETPKWGKASDDCGEQPREEGEEGDPEDDDGPDQPIKQERFIALPSVMQGTREAVLRDVDMVTKAQWGFTLTEDHIPGDRCSPQDIAEVIKTVTEVHRNRKVD